jgi:hypothetical protein
MSLDVFVSLSCMIASALWPHFAHSVIGSSTSFIVEPCAEIYIDEFSAILTENLDDEFKDE